MGYCTHKKNKAKGRIKVLNEIGKANTEKFKSKEEAVKVKIKQELNKKCKPREGMNDQERIEFFRRCHSFNNF